MWKNSNRYGWGLVALWAIMAVTPSMTHATGGAWQTAIYPWCQFFLQQTKAPAKTPMAAVKDLDANLEDYRTGANLSSLDRAHNRRLKRHILYGTFDIRELCRVAMGKNWADRSTAEQDRLVDLMTALMEEKAILSKEQEQGKVGAGGQRVYSIQYLAEQYLGGNRQRALVRTTVSVPTRKLTVALSYKLKLRGGMWKIYDVIIDDSSLVDNYAYQFNSIIEKNGYAELVNRMERKLNELRGTATP